MRIEKTIRGIKLVGTSGPRYPKEEVLLLFAACSIVAAAGCDDAATRKPQNESKPEVERVYEGKAADYWILQLRDLSPKRREKAVDALERFGKKDPRIVPGLLAIVKDIKAEPESRRDALTLYAGMEAEMAAPVLIRCLSDAESLVRERAAMAFRDYVQKPCPEAVEALLKIVENRKDTSEARWTAAYALTEYHDKDGKQIKSLIAVISDEKEDIGLRMNVISAIEKLGSRAKEAIPALRKLADQDAVFSSDAKSAIEKIEK